MKQVHKSHVAGRKWDAAWAVVLIIGLVITTFSFANAQPVRRGAGGAMWDQPFDRSLANSWEAHPSKGFATLSKANLEPMRATIQRYQAIVNRGGWPTLPRYQLKTGTRHRTVATLRQRLEMSGDLRQPGGRPRVFDYYVEAALKRFQMRHGLSPSGVVDEATLLALNVSADTRLRQLRTNLKRLEELTGKIESRHVVVNIPAAQVEVVENNRVVLRHSAVVGKIDRQTPELQSKIHEVNFNPYWRVPRSIVRKDLVPKARQYIKDGLDIIDAYRLEVYDPKGKRLAREQIDWYSDDVYKYSYRQVPWEENSLGFVKINFHNKHSVYMHDTPLKDLFGSNFRAQSSGCVRVQNVETLASWLLRETPGWSTSRVIEMKRTGEQRDVALKKRIPLYFVYLTAWATPEGIAQFRRDVYQKDGVDITASAY